ncbi:MAG: hypothetical protein HC825_01480 [Oscillatoriales cyanobacterium RM1_1_9]|nr:hypothetical protein [Oscillatoriales cyanobacterium RM2_1_1]NJO70733.1 hypothetical protein [Oscillatoriales cyanobacterium RM1_1_9]
MKASANALVMAILSILGVSGLTQIVTAQSPDLPVEVGDGADEIDQINAEKINSHLAKVAPEPFQGSQSKDDDGETNNNDNGEADDDNDRETDDD